MVWGAPLSSDIVHITALTSPILNKIKSVAIFGNEFELDEWIAYNSCCMLQNQTQKMSEAQLDEVRRYTDGYAMKLEADFPVAQCTPGPGITCLDKFEQDQQGFCIATELNLECVIADAVAVSGDDPVWKSYVMNSWDDFHYTRVLTTETLFYGEVTKHGGEYGFFHGWQCATNDITVICHRFLPREDWENIMDLRYSEEEVVNLYHYEESAGFATLLADTVILKDARLLVSQIGALAIAAFFVSF